MDRPSKRKSPDHASSDSSSVRDDIWGAPVAGDPLVGASSAQSEDAYSDIMSPSLTRFDADDSKVFGSQADLYQGGISSADGGDEVINSLRPTAFSEYLGQETLKSAISVACDGARRRNDPLDHVLLHGPPGLGKTSLARLIAIELGVKFRATSGPVIERPGDLAAILTSLERHDVLFIDEIHRIPRVVEEVLYSALEDFQIDILIGQGAAARSVQVKLKPFTLVGATTRSGMLSSPLRDRFGIIHRLEFYSPDELRRIVERSARLLNCELDGEVAAEIGARSRGTPRIANRLLRRVRDYGSYADGDVSNKTMVTLSAARQALTALQIDAVGLDAMDRRILETIMGQFNGGPVGLDTIATAIGEEAETIEDVYEPFLVQSGFIARTRRGREVTDHAYRHLGQERVIRG